MQGENRRRLTTSQRLCWISGIVLGLGVWAFLAQPGLNGTFALAAGTISAVAIGWVLSRVFRPRQKAPAPMADAEILQVPKEINPALSASDHPSDEETTQAQADYFAADIVDVIPVHSDDVDPEFETGPDDETAVDEDVFFTRPLFGGAVSDEDPTHPIAEELTASDVDQAVEMSVGPLAGSDGEDVLAGTAVSDTPAPTPAPAPTDVKDLGPGGMSEPRLEGPDQLTLIEGVDKRMLRRLTNIGIYHFDQIAAWTDDDVVAATAAMGIGHKNRVKNQGWVEQAQDLAAGKFPEDTSVPGAVPDAVTETVNDDSDGQRAE